MHTSTKKHHTCYVCGEEYHPGHKCSSEDPYLGSITYLSEELGASHTCKKCGSVYDGNQVTLAKAEMCLMCLLASLQSIADDLRQYKIELREVNRFTDFLKHE